MNEYLSLLGFDEIKATQNCKRLAWLFSVIAISNIVGFNVPFIGKLYIPICIVCLIYIIVCGQIKVNGLYVFLYITFGISSLLAVEAFFKSDLRYLLFLCVTLVCSSCLSSSTSISFRYLICRNLLVLLSGLTLGSFICFFLGINFVGASSVLRNDVLSAGIFGGLYSHSMLLGPLSALVAVMFLNAYLYSQKRILAILFLISSAAVVMSASRGAVLALVIPIVYSVCFDKNIGRNKRSLIGVILLATIVIFSVGDRFASGLMEKQKRNEQSGGTFSSRDSKWKNRIEEFEDYPITGIGFCAVDEKHTDDYLSHGESIEPGSSHLAVLSMTGLLGFLAYILVLIDAYKSVCKRNDKTTILRRNLFLVMITHAMFEGYALFAGGFLSLMYWLIIGQCIDRKRLLI